MADFLRICDPFRFRFGVKALLAGERTPCSRFTYRVSLEQRGDVCGFRRACAVE
jgi:hypothetical protein